MTEPADDARLLSLSAEGDQAAFTSLMDRYYEGVHRLLLSLGASEHDAEDALQDCFISAWRSAGSFHGGSSARAWLYSIARNALRRLHRKRSGEPTNFETLESLGAAAGWGVEVSFAHDIHIRDELTWGLRQLPDLERQVLLLRDVYGLTGEETAEALGLSKAAMKSRLHRGRLRLMSVLRQDNDDA